MKIINDLRAFLVRKGYLNDHAVSENQSLLEDGLIDSLAVLELTSYLEETFGVQVSEDDLLPENFQSLAAMRAYVGRKTAARGG